VPDRGARGSVPIITLIRARPNPSTARTRRAAPPTAATAAALAALLAALTAGPAVGSPTARTRALLQAKTPSKTKKKSSSKKSKSKKPKAKTKRFSSFVVDGPSPNIQSLGGMVMGRNGGGAVVYVKTVGGVGHIFASVLSGRSWTVPVQVDKGLNDASAQPVVGVGDNGEVAVAFVNDQTLYQAVEPGTGQPFVSPVPIANPATNPSLGMAPDGASYVSFTDPRAPAQVRIAHMAHGEINFHLNPRSLNIDPSRNAGDTAAKRSRVAVSGDGTAMVTWGEDAPEGRVHVWARRVARDLVSAVPQDLTLASFDGATGAGVDAAQVGLDDDGSLGRAVFRQGFSQGGAAVNRALSRRLIGSLFEGPVPMDGLTFPASDAADPPQLSETGAGDALVTVGLAGSHQTMASVARPSTNVFTAPAPVDRVANAIDPQPAPAMADHGIGLVAWLQSSAAGAPVSVVGDSLARFTFTKAVTLSTSTFGSVDPTNGLYASTDRLGDVTVAYLQAAATGRSVVLGGEVRSGVSAPIGPAAAPPPPA